MRIAQIAPIWASVPPKKYGGTERIVSSLTEELVSRGHDVTLFASGDSKTSANLVSYLPKAVFERDDKIEWGNELLSMYHLSKSFMQADEFDIIHGHEFVLTQFFTSFTKVPVVTTLHTAIYSYDSKTEGEILNKYKKNNYVSISKNQQVISKLKLNYSGVVYNGIDVDRFPFYKEGGEYLIWVGRITQIKGPHEAIEVAKKSGHKLILIGPVDQRDEHNYKYFQEKIKPHIDDKNVIFYEELGDEERNSKFKKAKALLFPISWEEPFGLVPVEAMAMGVPPIVYNRGAMPEIVTNGENGFIAKNVEEMVEAVGKISSIDRKKCRKHVIDNFSVNKMTDEYEKIYQKLIKK